MAVMFQTGEVTVRVDLQRIRANVREIRERAGVAVLAVVKADAYGLGIERIAEVVADLVEGFCVFDAREAIEARLWERTALPSIVLGPPMLDDPEVYVRHRVRPAVSNVEQAKRLREADPLLCVDTGMQRFACPPGEIEAVLAAGGCREAFTHAASMAQVERLKQLTGRRGLRLHAAGSSLLDEPGAWLDAVRPGLAMYRGAVRVTVPLAEARDSAGPAGYTGFRAARHGVVVCGYANGLRKGPCLVNGQGRRIVEVGMQSAFVEIGEEDGAVGAGDEVVLLGDSLAAEDIAAAWGSTPHEVLVRLASAGKRQYG